MALERRGGERQGALWVATGESPRAPRHVFYEKLNGVLKAAGFDAFVEELCEEYFAAYGRPSIPPGVFFRMVLIGYFEDISSQRTFFKPRSRNCLAPKCCLMWAKGRSPR